MATEVSGGHFDFGKGLDDLMEKIKEDIRAHGKSQRIEVEITIARDEATRYNLAFEDIIYYADASGYELSATTIRKSFN